MIGKRVQFIVDASFIAPKSLLFQVSAFTLNAEKELY